MIDFHSHFLPGIDDGAEDTATSLTMLRESCRQGVDLICATPHFYADRQTPRSFLQARNNAFQSLRKEMDLKELWPKIRLGAEVYYFPGMSVAEEMKYLTLEGTPLLLIEPPMRHWTSSMLDEIEECGKNLHVVPVIAHVDRYMRLLRDNRLLEKLKERRVLCQVNASFFLRLGTYDLAMESLRAGRIHFIGSDCHNISDRAPNMGNAEDVILGSKDGRELLKRLNDRVLQVIKA